MNKRYRLSMNLYIGLSAFIIFFLLLIYGATGHQITFKEKDVLIPIFAVLTSLTLILFKKTTKDFKWIKAFLYLLMIALLTTNIYYVINHYLSFYDENLIIGFMIFSTFLVGVFSFSCVILIFEGGKELMLCFNPNSKEKPLTFHKATMP